MFPNTRVLSNLAGAVTFTAGYHLWIQQHKHRTA